jgi:hypothetical protein
MYFKFLRYADVAELADAHDSKSCSLTGVWVRLPPSALRNREKALGSRVLTNVRTLFYFILNMTREGKIVCGEVKDKCEKWKMREHCRGRARGKEEVN